VFNPGAQAEAKLLAETRQQLQPVGVPLIASIFAGTIAEFAEVAQIVGTSEGAVRVRAHRAYTTLKQLLVSEIRGDE